jgi:hypothetical protein
MRKKAPQLQNTKPACKGKVKHSFWSEQMCTTKTNTNVQAQTQSIHSGSVEAGGNETGEKSTENKKRGQSQTLGGTAITPAQEMSSRPQKKHENKKRTKEDECRQKHAALDRLQRRTKEL